MISSLDENTMNGTTETSSEKTRRKNIESQKIARKKILEYLYDKNYEQPSFFASLNALKNNTALDNSKIIRALRYLKQEDLIFLYDSFEMAKESKSICKISPRGIKEVESKSTATKKHEGDESILDNKSIGFKDVQYRHSIRTKILKFLYKSLHERPDYIPSIIDIFEATGLDSSQLQEIQLAISYLNDEKLIEHLDGSVEEYGKHLNPQRPLGNITSKGMQKVEESLRGKALINKEVEENLNRQKVLEFYFHHNRKQNKQAQAAISVGELPNQKEEFPYIDDIEKGTGLTREKIIFHLINLRDDGFLELLANPGILSLPSTYRRSSSRQGFPSAITKAGILQVKLWQDEASISAKEKKTRTSQIKNECQKVLENRVEKKEKIEIDPQLEKAEKKPDIEQPSDEYIFRKEAEYWYLVYQGKDIGRFKKKKGFEYIKILLQHPEQTYSSQELQEEVNKISPNVIRSDEKKAGIKAAIRSGQLPVTSSNSSIEGNDRRARREYEVELERLGSEITEARKSGETDKVNSLLEEMDRISEELKKVPRTRNNANDNVWKCIERVRQIIATANNGKPLYHHLKEHIHTGCDCIYTPPPVKEIPWNF